MNGGDVVAAVLQAHGVRFLFTLCGGHISPILVSAKARGIRVVDVRHEATAVFAADAVARLTGVPGVAAVTAGPGVTNAVTAIKNAEMAQSPLVVLGGATATLLRGRGALQDIDQLALTRPHVKWAARVGRARDLAPALERAFAVAASDVPGPVFVECPVDLLYPADTVRALYGAASRGPGWRGRVLRRYVDWHVARLLADAETAAAPATPTSPHVRTADVRAAAGLLARAQRPVVVAGSQAVLAAGDVDRVADAVAALGVPAYLSGMARGLLGPGHPLQMRHRRKEALREADFVLLAGVPCDFRLDYGRHIPARAVLVSVNLSRRDLRRNRRPALAVNSPPGPFLRELARARAPAPAWTEWTGRLRVREAERDADIARQADEPSQGGLNPLAACAAVDRALAPGSIVVADGGDFVGTASYVLRPRGPLSWLDPGPFGTLGVGAGFALGARLARPEADVWILYGDGSAGYSLMEADTFVRHGLGVVAVIGNDAAWAQIAREQVEMLGDDVGVLLRHSDYHRAAEGLGASGFRVDEPGALEDVLARALACARAGRPVYVNAVLGRSAFRKGSISL
jgi:acetolactate synthase-1/2/3 large subunit